MVDRRCPSDECPQCENGHGSHSEKCRLRFDKVRLLETELTQAEIPLALAATTTTEPATTSASTSIPLTNTSKSTLDAQTSATDVSMQATCEPSGGLKRPIEANGEMETGVGDADTDVPMSGACSRMDHFRNSELPTFVISPISDGVEECEQQDWSLSARCPTARLALRSPVRRYWRIAKRKWIGS